MQIIIWTDTGIFIWVALTFYYLLSNKILLFIIFLASVHGFLVQSFLFGQVIQFFFCVHIGVRVYYYHVIFELIHIINCHVVWIHQAWYYASSFKDMIFLDHLSLILFIFACHYLITLLLIFAGESPCLACLMKIADSVWFWAS